MIRVLITITLLIIRFCSLMIRSVWLKLIMRNLRLPRIQYEHRWHQIDDWRLRCQHIIYLQRRFYEN